MIGRVVWASIGLFVAVVSTATAQPTQAPVIPPKLVAAFDRWQRGEREAARRDLDAAVAAQPGDSAVVLLVANFFVEQREWKAAEPHARRGCELRPDLPHGVILLAATLLETERAEEAERSLRPAVARFAADPLVGELRFHLGVACALQNKRLEASEWLERAITARPGNSAWHVSLGENELNLRRLPRAEAAFRAALAAPPVHGDARWKLAVTLAEAGRDGEAEPLFVEAVREEGAAVGSATLRFAIFLFERGRAAEAIVRLEALLAARPGERMAWNWYARALRATGRAADAKRALARYQQLQAEADRQERDYLLSLIAVPQMPGAGIETARPPGGEPPGSRN